MIASGASGDFAKARELHHALHPLFHAMFLESNPVPVKTAMAWREMMTAQFRAPLGPMGEVAKDAFIKNPRKPPLGLTTKHDLKRGGGPSFLSLVHAFINRSIS